MRILVSGATKTVRQFAAQYPDHLGVLMTPQNGNRLCALPLPWAADNAAFSKPDDAKFSRLCVESWAMEGYHPPMWLAVPDVVGDHAATLRLFGWWCDEWQNEYGCIPFPLAFVLQDGCRPEEVPWDEIAAVFVGGSTEFKLRQSSELITEAKRRQKRVHIGRVNTLQRLRYAHDVGADTVDGTAFSMFPDIKIPWALQYLQTLERSRTLF